MHGKHAQSRRWAKPAFSVPAVALILCACATPYKPGKGSFGYSDYRISADVFSISFRGNASTREETVELYLLRRASELALEHGYKYFLVISEKGRTRSSSIGYSAIKVPIIAPGAAIQVRCFHDRPPASDSVIDAAAFLGFNFPEALERFESEQPGGEP